MGMPVILEVIDTHATKETFEGIFNYFTEVDERFSTYKNTSEVMRFNRGEITERDLSAEMREVLALAERTREETDGYFNIAKSDGTIDPSGIVKGWAIQKAAEKLRAHSFKNFYLEIGGDIQTAGTNAEGKEWRVGIRNPFTRDEIVKTLYPRASGIATSGTYARGAHIYNPHEPETSPGELVSITVVGKNILEADRFATAAFAMGKRGLLFIENLPGFEAYGIDPSGIATMTTGFAALTTV